MENSENKVEPKANDLSGKDVEKFGKDVIRTASLWALAGALSDLVKGGIKSLFNKNKSNSQ